MRRASGWAMVLAATALLACVRHELKGAPPQADIRFPEDHGAHPAQTEWWHFHGHLIDNQGHAHDFFLGFVRWHFDEDKVLFIPMRWVVDPGQAAVFSVTDRHGQKFRRREKYAYPDVWAASAAEGGLALAHDDWAVHQTSQGMRLSATAQDVELELLLSPGKPVVLEGQNGLFQAPPHLFYTLPRLPASGTLKVGEQRLTVRGEAWVKHEWGTLYSDDVAGFVWFGIQLDDGTELQVGLLKDLDWKQMPGSFAELVDSQGAVERLDLSQLGVMQTGEVWTSPTSGATYPVRWRLELPGQRGTLELSTTVPQQELFMFPAPIWAGSLEATGTVDGRAVQGSAMVEVFGLQQPFFRGLYRSGISPTSRRAP